MLLNNMFINIIIEINGHNIDTTIISLNVKNKPTFSLNAYINDNVIDKYKIKYIEFMLFYSPFENNVLIVNII
jgi:hypothetical protein